MLQKKGARLSPRSSLLRDVSDGVVLILGVLLLPAGDALRAVQSLQVQTGGTIAPEVAVMTQSVPQPHLRGRVIGQDGLIIAATTATASGHKLFLPELLLLGVDGENLVERAQGLNVLLHGEFLLFFYMISF